MSYSMNDQCFTCEKSKKCVDREIIRGAIDTIHGIGSGKGHLGFGSVDLNCQGFEQKEEVAG